MSPIYFRLKSIATYATPGFSPPPRPPSSPRHLLPSARGFGQKETPATLLATSLVDGALGLFEARVGATDQKMGLFVSAAPLPPPLDVTANNNPRKAIFRRAGPSSQKNGAGKKAVTFATPESKTHEYTLPDGELASRREHMQKIRDKKPEARKDVAKDSERKWRTGVVKAVLGGEKYHSYVSPEAAKHTKRFLPRSLPPPPPPWRRAGPKPSFARKTSLQMAADHEAADTVLPIELVEIAVTAASEFVAAANRSFVPVRKELARASRAFRSAFSAPSEHLVVPRVKNPSTTH
ncbi:hypothetical protein DFJ73DRAFT_784575 [Zopfochytrium polystomum]|nr:hypothetical protein DFJ73DRAFT_784575 [Zopfochytrium polystomum]